MKFDKQFFQKQDKNKIYFIPNVKVPIDSDYSIS